MERDLETKRKKLDEKHAEPMRATHSRFFMSHSALSPPNDHDCQDKVPAATAGLSKLWKQLIKENIPPSDEAEVDFCTDDDKESCDPLTPDDGYISPPPFYEQNNDDTNLDDNFTSPLPLNDILNDGFGVDPVSSPPMSRNGRRSPHRDRRGADALDGSAFAQDNHAPGYSPRNHIIQQQPEIIAGEPDIKFKDGVISEADRAEEECGKNAKQRKNSGKDPQSRNVGGSDGTIKTPGPHQLEAKSNVVKNHVALGWSAKWAYCGKSINGRLRVTSYVLLTRTY
jgi:hypothetical protein